MLVLNSASPQYPETLPRKPSRLHLTPLLVKLMRQLLPHHSRPIQRSARTSSEPDQRGSSVDLQPADRLALHCQNPSGPAIALSERVHRLGRGGSYKDNPNAGAVKDKFKENGETRVYGPFDLARCNELLDEANEDADPFHVSHHLSILETLLLMPRWLTTSHWPPNNSGNWPWRDDHRYMMRFGSSRNLRTTKTMLRGKWQGEILTGALLA